MQDEGLLQAVHRLVKDVEFRQRFLSTPRETLMEELGISLESYKALAAIVPVLLAGGVAELSKITPEWNQW